MTRNKKILIKYLLSFILGILIVGGVWAYNYWWANPEEPIGGERDEHGCLLMAGYTWCEAKQKCLRVWEEGCGITNQPASRNNIPEDKETCEAQKGEWGRFGLSIKEQCNLPTSDAGKTCSNQDECEGACLVDLSQEGQDRVTEQKEIIETNGRCTSWLFTYGCNAYVEDGKVAEILCTD